MKAANEDTARELTGRFQKHLIDSGIPEKQAMKSRVEWNKDTNGYKPKVPQFVQDNSLGTASKPPTGVIPKFFNRLTEKEINDIHGQALFDRSRENGLT